jgi:hypothetical protein
LVQAALPYADSRTRRFLNSAEALRHLARDDQLMTTITPGQRNTVARTMKLTTWAGWSAVAVALAHIAYFVVDTWPQWAGWISGKLWGLSEGPETASSMIGFWALPAGFAVPLLLLGLLTVRLARAGQALPGYVGWTLLSWAGLCSFIIEPSGFPLAFVPAILLILARPDASPDRSPR